uniref:Uncharacterized protein n=1 Tax=Aegilops tauschii subsp. strangulata TaxID=200361 RepID=A0A452Z8W9_AEGTS
MLYFQLKVPHLTTNQGPHGLQPAFGGAAIVYLVELHPTTPGGGDCNPGAAYNGEEDSNQLHPSTAELQSCTSELQPAFGGATRAASGKTWNNDEMGRVHDDCYFQAAERSGELRVTMMAVAVVGWDELGATAMEGLPERRDSGSCAGGGSDAMDFGDLGRILSFFFSFFSHARMREWGTKRS